MVLRNPVLNSSNAMFLCTYSVKAVLSAVSPQAATTLCSSSFEIYDMGQVKKDRSTYVCIASARGRQLHDLQRTLSSSCLNARIDLAADLSAKTMTKLRRVSGSVDYNIFENGTHRSDCRAGA